KMQHLTHEDPTKPDKTRHFSAKSPAAYPKQRGAGGSLPGGYPLAGGGNWSPIFPSQGVQGTPCRGLGGLEPNSLPTSKTKGCRALPAGGLGVSPNYPPTTQ